MLPPRIHQLDSHVIDHIAAGEVVERPASVVKELLENAYDAGASLVQVELERGGLQRVTITDDGHGMRPEDAKHCILRHATSKLRSAGDLFCLTTLGFRGEALSSIAAIAKVTITTRPHAALEGFRLVVHGGNVVCAEPAGCPKGTCIDVASLFFNTPARHKFMRAPATEQAHVVEAGLRVALGAQRGGLIVCSGNRRLIDLPEYEAKTDGKSALGQQRDRVHSALGHRLGRLSPVHLVEAGVHLSGFVSEPQLSRSETRGLWLFVNGRFVRDRMLQRAVLESFQVHCPDGYPTAILWLQLDPQAVDINVHPQKLEVRFADAQQIYRMVGTAVAASLSPTKVSAGPGLVQTETNLRGWPPKANSVCQKTAIPPQPRPAGEANSQAAPAKNRRFYLPASTNRHDAGAAKWLSRRAGVPFAAAGAGKPARRPSAFVCTSPMPTHKTQPRHKQAPNVKHYRQGDLPKVGSFLASKKASAPNHQSFREIQPLASMQPGYLLGRVGEALVLVDGLQALRHLVSERLRAQFASNELVRHILMLPPTFVAPKAWAKRLESRWEDWLAWGLELDCVGPDQYAVRAIPKVLAQCEPVAVVHSCLDVVLRMQDVQNLSGLRRCVEARWLQLVSWSAPQSDECAAIKLLFDDLADAKLDINAVSFARRFGEKEFASLLH